ncbi:MAG TPA: aminoglycoside phosphotransferase family protein [Herpetosiphonaceae bacterium]
MSESALRAPTEQDAMTVVEVVMQRPAHQIERFPTGLCHYVYDVVTDHGQRVVVRLARADTAPLLLGGINWSRVLRPRGVPLPALLHADATATIVPFAFMLLEHLPGVDLGRVYAQMSRQHKRGVAAAIVRIQRLVHALPPGSGYGYATALQTALPHQSWTALVAQTLIDAHQHIARVGVVDLRHVDRVERRLPRFKAYLDAVAPTAFLDDTTTKNVLIDRGRVAGIVDVDVVCYGDPLWTVALTQMALLQQRLDLDYIAAWTELLNLTREQQRILPFYTAVFCIGFLSELGIAHNQASAAAVEAARVDHLTRILDTLLEAC